MKDWCSNPFILLPSQRVFTSWCVRGSGIAWLPHSLVAQDLVTGFLCKLPLPEIELDIRLYWRKNDERESIQAIVNAPTPLFTDGPSV